jgi:hypothetical protein
MSRKKSFPLRLDEAVFDALRRWADDELRSVNAQVEYALREALKRAGRWPKESGAESGRSPG